MAQRLVPGLRLRRWMERMGVRAAGADPPDVGYNVQLVHQVGDSSDLVPAFYGPRAVFGSDFTTVGRFGEIQVFSGPRGCRVFLDVQHLAGDLLPRPGSWRMRIVDPATAPTGAAFTVPSAGNVTGVCTMWLQDPTLPVYSRCLIGGVLGGSALPPDSPAYYTFDTIAAMAPFWHIGGTEFKPFLFVAPNRCLRLQAFHDTSLNYFLSGYLEEPYEEPHP